MSTQKEQYSYVERVVSDNSSKNGLDKTETMGTVKLTAGKTIYIPTPTADPQDPLNMKTWQKLVVTVLVSIFSTLGLALVSGFGGLLGFYIPEYAASGHGTYEAISRLLTFPSLFMGIGNLIGMPLAIAVGRRSVLLGSTIILVVSAILSACAKTYEWHLGARMFMGLAAGQSEAVVPMVVQEIYFLHERSRGLMIQQTVQVILSTIWTLFASPIAGAITPQGWYYLGAGLAAVQFILTLFFLPETKYERSLGAYQEKAASKPLSDAENAQGTSQGEDLATERPALDFVNYAPRTWRSDMRLWVGTPEWSKAFTVLVQTFTVLIFPNVFWAMLLNGLTLGVNIAIGITYGGIVTSAPYNWAQSSASYANCGQIVTALAALPLLGYGSDLIIKWKANRNGGIHEPESRLIPLIIPIIVGTFTAVLYGQAAAHPNQYHWFTVVWAIAAYYFAFVGANIVAITYLLDSYPARAGPILVNICAFRGIISFGTTYAITPFINRCGYDGSFGAYAGMTAGIGLLAIPVYFYGKRIRGFTARFAKDKHTA
ncbi:hypothetical protein H2198_004482 [Neophaeococcomyces mojaviensis]|uniref:Uncharacterized protein n=1 Tax=Neophaeococcomyces mojaviensis TaxID=3383035 RepID=A0ACC3A8A5_9EURO|nr:hypothetical protein H2198_004482 [Knufia sp. JES_112]